MLDNSQTISSDEALHLPEALDLRTATGLAASILTHQGNQLLLNGSKVKKVGAQCLQILVSAARMWERDGVPFALAEPSDELKNSLAVAGIGIDMFSEKETKQ
jgi:chemotaxis protein CheX